MLIRFLRLATLVVGALTLQLATSCAGAGETHAALSPAAGAEQETARPAIWRVADEDTTIYLFGTIHALPRDLAWYGPQIATALEASDELVTEVDLSAAQKMPALVLSKATLPEGQNLRAMLTPEERKIYEETMVSLGLPIETFDRYEPWYAAMTFSLIPLLNAGYDTESGVESVLARHFGESKERDHLETVDFQIDLFDSLPMETQLKYLNEVVRTVPGLTEELDAMVVEWLEGDANALAKLINAQETDPLVYKRVITDRNANWADWIDKRLDQPGTVFMAVGAGHLAGKGSVQDQLRKRGIKSARLR